MKRSHLLILLFLIILRFILGRLDFNLDVYNHIQWGQSLLKFGANGFYARDFSPWASPNYPPLANDIFWLMQYLYNHLVSPGLKTVDLQAYFYKIPLFISDGIIGFVLYFVGKKKKRGMLFSLLFLLNPSTMFNSVFWGQTESLVTLFCLLSAFFFFRKTKIPAFVFFALAVLTKQSSLFFVPIFLFLAIVRTSTKEKIFGFGLFAVIVWIFFYFYYPSSFITASIRFYLQTSGGHAYQHLASVNAFNYWYLLGLNKISDGLTVFFLSLRWLSFFIVGFFAANIILLLKKNSDLQTVLIASGLLAAVTFLFLTRMHERHLFTAIVFLIPIATKGKKIFLYILLSLIHFSNLFWIWQSKLPIPSLVIGGIEYLSVFLAALSIIIFFTFFFIFLKEAE